MKGYALIADSDIAAAAVYATAAREEGLSYLSVRDGALAVSAIMERGVPGLLVTEIELPYVDGFDLIDQVRRAPGGADTAVIVVSASRDVRERAAARRAQLDIGAVLAKAASAESVRRVIRCLIGTEGGTETHPPQNPGRMTPPLVGTLRGPFPALAPGKLGRHSA
jgi:CheY-like chemotaxis protein